LLRKAQRYYDSVGGGDQPVTETQQTVSVWAKATFGRRRKEKLVSYVTDHHAGLTEAVLSARRAKAKRELVIRTCADILIALFQVATAYKFDLWQAVDQRMFVLRGLEWPKPKGGTEKSATTIQQHELPYTETPVLDSAVSPLDTST